MADSSGGQTSSRVGPVRRARGDVTVPRLIGALDIGGTNIKGGLFTEKMEVLTSFREPTHRNRGPQAVLDAVSAMALRIRTKAIQQTGTPPAAMGVACLGLIDEESGRCIYSAAVGWRRLPIRDILEHHVGLPVHLGHDIRAAARAEYELGSAPSADVSLFVAIGTGIGAAVTVGGRPLLGARQRAMELGHLQVRPGGNQCACGQRGCLEAHASARAISVAASKVAGSAVSAAELASAAERGEPWAATIWRGAVDALADGLVASSVMFDPQVVVVGGGLSLAGPALLEPLRIAMNRRYPFDHPPPIAAAALGDGAALLGAALMARDAQSCRGGPA